MCVTVKKPCCFYSFAINSQSKQKKFSTLFILETFIKINSRFHGGFFELEILEIFTTDFLLKTIIWTYLSQEVKKETIWWVFHQGLRYNTTCGYRSATSIYHDSIGSFSAGKHPRISSLISSFNNRMPQSRYCFIWDVEKVLNSLDSERIELKMLTYKVTMLLALTGSSRADEICYLDIRYLIKQFWLYPSL